MSAAQPAACVPPPAVCASASVARHKELSFLRLGSRRAAAGGSLASDGSDGSDGAGRLVASTCPDRDAFASSLRRTTNTLTDAGSTASVRFGAICDAARACFPPEAIAALQSLTDASAAGPRAPAAEARPAAGRATDVTGDAGDSDDDDGAAGGVTAAPTGAALGVVVSASLASAWDGPLHKAVLSRLGDEAERVREGSAALLAAFWGLDGAVFDLSETLPFALPALLERCCPAIGYDPEEHCFIEDMEGETGRAAAPHNRRRPQQRGSGTTHQPAAATARQRRRTAAGGRSHQPT